MKTRISKIGDTTIVAMDGVLDYETQAPFQQNLSRILEKNKSDAAPLKVIFDFENLEFVGSSGISNLVQTIKDFQNRSHTRSQFLNVKSEFRRVIEALDRDASFDFMDAGERVRKQYDN